MPLLIKMLSAEDTADTDTRKTHQIMTDVTHVEFLRNDDGTACMAVIFKDQDDTEVFDVTGNVYVMNENGKTISSFGSAPLIFADEGK